jgi:DNA-directed RNA polymerase subunit RPC12/RpoP
MKIKQAIEKAIEGGWKYEGETPRCDELYDTFYISDYDGGFENLNLYKAFLDPNFWQCLGKAMNLPEIVCNNCGKEAARGEGRYYYECEDCGLLVEEDYPVSPWLRMMHRLIDHLSEGGTIEKYFEELD